MLANCSEALKNCLSHPCRPGHSTKPWNSRAEPSSGRAKSSLHHPHQGPSHSSLQKLQPAPQVHSCTYLPTYLPSSFPSFLTFSSLPSFFNSFLPSYIPFCLFPTFLPLMMFYIYYLSLSHSSKDTEKEGILPNSYVRNNITLLPKLDKDTT